MAARGEQRDRQYLMPPDSVDELLGAAGRLLDTAKRSGKNAVAHETKNEALSGR